MFHNLGADREKARSAVLLSALEIVPLKEGPRENGRSIAVLVCHVSEAVLTCGVDRLVGRSAVD